MNDARSVFEGDEWKGFDSREPEPVLDRAQHQERADTAYMFGRISLNHWRAITDALSEPVTALRRKKV